MHLLQISSKAVFSGTVVMIVPGNKDKGKIVERHYFSSTMLNPCMAYEKGPGMFKEDLMSKVTLVKAFLTYSIFTRCLVAWTSHFNKFHEMLR